jgi:hypothetical protein
MLKLIYDVKCGFDELYVVKKNQEIDLTGFVDCWNETLKDFPPLQEEYEAGYDNLDPTTVEEVYNQYKDRPLQLLDDERFTCVGEIISEEITMECINTYFRHICKVNLKNPICPELLELSNVRLVLTGDKPLVANPVYPTKTKSLKAKEVMELLKISRQTLSNYVKQGLIKVDSTINGKYRYNKDSVLALMKGSK